MDRLAIFKFLCHIQSEMHAVAARSGGLLSRFSEYSSSAGGKPRTVHMKTRNQVEENFLWSTHYCGAKRKLSLKVIAARAIA